MGLVGLVVIVAVSGLSDWFDERTRRTAAESLRAAQERLDDSLRAVLAQDRAGVLQRGRDGGLGALEPYLALDDPEVQELADSLREDQLVTELRSIPASEFARNASIYEELQRLRPDLDRYRERAEYYRGRAEAQAQDQRAAVQESARLAYPAILDQFFLDQGMDVRIEVRGQRAETLRMTYVLFDRVWANEFSKASELWQSFRDLGFKRVELRDGYDFAWAWTLD